MQSGTPGNAGNATHGIEAMTALYAAMRQQLESALAQPEKDMVLVDSLVHELAQLQLRIKAAHGLQGNNPNE